MISNLIFTIIFYIFVIYIPLNAHTFQSIKTKGYIELANYDFLKNDYNKLYEKFDNFIAVMSENQDFSKKIRASEKEFLNNVEQKKRYCSAPPSYRNPREDASKRHNKIYFQFMSDYYEFLKLNCSQELLDNSDVKAFLEGMLCIDMMAKKMFHEMLIKFEKKQTGISKLFYGNHNQLTVITKIVRYEQAEPDRWGTTAHFDKSGFTFIWDSSDEDNDSLLICDDLSDPSLNKLSKPLRRFAHKDDVSSTIMISGAAFSKLGIAIKPTLHGVAPIRNFHRFAIISFLLIPDIDMSEIKTDFEPRG